MAAAVENVRTYLCHPPVLLNQHYCVCNSIDMDITFKYNCTTHCMYAYALTVNHVKIINIYLEYIT